MKVQRVQPTGEHGYEPVHGLPGRLPPGERMLWQGAPAVLPLAVQALHLRKLAIYFGLLMAWRAAGVLADGGGLLDAARALAWAVPMSALGLGLVFGLGWLYASTTVYTLTNKRVVLRLGIVLTVTFNLPLARIEGVTLRRHSDGTGDLMLRLPDTERIAFLHLWPHVRPWRINHTEPMLRALADIDVVAPLLASALQATLDETARSAQAAAAAAALAGPEPVSAPVTTAPDRSTGHGGLQPAAA
jgi:hypothetical protein